MQQALGYVVGAARLELATAGLAIRSSVQLMYAPTHTATEASKGSILAGFPTSGALAHPSDLHIAIRGAGVKGKSKSVLFRRKMTKARRFAILKVRWHAEIVDQAHDGFCARMAEIDPTARVDAFDVPGGSNCLCQRNGWQKSGSYDAIAAAGQSKDGLSKCGQGRLAALVRLYPFPGKAVSLPGRTREVGTAERKRIT